MPTHVEVPNLPLPDVVLESTEFRLPFITFDPGDATARVDCGAMVSPTEIRLPDASRFVEFFSQPDQFERRARQGCDESHDRRWQLVVLSLIGAGMLIGFAVVSGLRSATGAPLAPSPPSPEPTWAHPVRPAARPTSSTSPPIAPPRPVAPPASPPIAPSVATPPDNGGSASSTSPIRRKQLVGATTAGLIVMVVLGGVVGIDRGAAPTAFLGQTEQTVDPVLVAAQQCVTVAFESIDSGYSRARMSSAEDRGRASINLDGDESWQGYSDALRLIELVGCSAEFRTTVVELANAWGEFGDDWLADSKGLSLDRLSDDDFLRHETRINGARRLLEDLAASIDVEVRLVNYNLN